MRHNSLRIVLDKDNRKFRLDVDASNLLETLKQKWPDASMDTPGGLNFSSINWDRDKLLHTLKQSKSGKAAGEEQSLLSCSCGVPECAGVRPVQLNYSDDGVKWTFRAISSEESLEFMFSNDNYAREIAKLEKVFSPNRS